ncbi:MAG: phosphatidylglycerol lysyltransferase domain-containing protein [Clostridiales bacterium]|nr:phosphatidylglycerol lysyltransferase domain-containing protein [Clostridiales bacterium]
MHEKMKLSKDQMDQAIDTLKMKKVDISSQAQLRSYYEAFDSEISDTSLTNVLLWACKYNFHFFTMDSFAFIVNIETDRLYFSSPIGSFDDETLVCEVTKNLKDLLNSFGIPLVIKKASCKFVKIIDHSSLFEMEALANRDESDYIYDYEPMKTLAGNKYHKKKNQVNKFIKTVENYNFRPYGSDDSETVMQLMEKWCLDHGCDNDINLQFEFGGVMHYLENSSVDHLLMGLLFVDDKLQGFILGEIVSKNMLLIHIEKANADIPGIYQMLGYEFYNMVSNESLLWINREQDLGIEGLRKSKMSYHPVRFVEKFELIFK